MKKSALDKDGCKKVLYECSQALFDKNHAEGVHIINAKHCISPAEGGISSIPKELYIIKPQEIHAYA